jgi:hypothetical protein
MSILESKSAGQSLAGAIRALKPCRHPEIHKSNREPGRSADKSQAAESWGSDINLDDLG